MPESEGVNRDKFLYPANTYHGKFTPQNLAFNANLQEFASKIGYICALETSGKIPSEEAYLQIRALYEALAQSKVGLGIGEEPAAEA